MVIDALAAKTAVAIDEVSAQNHLFKLDIVNLMNECNFFSFLLEVNKSECSVKNRRMFE